MFIETENQEERISKLLLRYIRFLGPLYSEEGLPPQQITYFRELLNRLKTTKQLISECVDCPLELTNIIVSYLW
jgi:hypothetical protein